MIDNEVPWNTWGQHLLAEMKDMLETLCQTRVVPDVEFFLNKRDHPQIRPGLMEPYEFVHPSIKGQKISIPFPKDATFAPIVSFFTDSNFADIPFPCADDWRVCETMSFLGTRTGITTFFLLRLLLGSRSLRRKEKLISTLQVLFRLSNTNLIMSIDNHK